MLTKNIRTISELNDLTDINLLSTVSINFEISKTSDNEINTYKISGKSFIEFLSTYMENIFDNKYVSLTANQDVRGKKTFIDTLECTQRLYCNNKSSDPILVCNTPISGVALSACWA